MTNHLRNALVAAVSLRGALVIAAAALALACATPLEDTPCKTAADCLVKGQSCFLGACVIASDKLPACKVECGTNADCSACTGGKNTCVASVCTAVTDPPPPPTCPSSCTRDGECGSCADSMTSCVAGRCALKSVDPPPPPRGRCASAAVGETSLCVEDATAKAGGDAKIELWIAPKRGCAKFRRAFGELKLSVRGVALPRPAQITMGSPSWPTRCASFFQYGSPNDDRVSFQLLPAGAGREGCPTEYPAGRFATVTLKVPASMKAGRYRVDLVGSLEGGRLGVDASPSAPGCTGKGAIAGTLVVTN